MIAVIVQMELGDPGSPVKQTEVVMFNTHAAAYQWMDSHQVHHRINYFVINCQGAHYVSRQIKALIAAD